jgi:hypothetical protein
MLLFAVYLTVELYLEIVKSSPIEATRSGTRSLGTW